jgi:hypothetical protein
MLQRIFNTIISIQLLFFTFSIYAKSNSDFLILKNLSDFRIYNKYEQKLSDADSLILIENCPLQILITDTLLSDGYTPCAITLLEDKLYYLVKKDLHQPIELINPSNTLLIKNATTLNDTIQIISPEGLFVQSPWKNEKNHYMGENSKLLRLFRKGPRTYAKALAPQVRYGWVSLKNQKEWKILNDNSKSNISRNIDVESILLERLENVNDILYKLFSYFNNIKGSDIIAPYWHLEKNEDGFECKIINIPEHSDFTESTNLLISDLQLSLSKLNYHINWQRDKIIITKKSK